MHYIVIALLREMLLGSIRIAIFGNIGNQSIGFGIKAVEIFVIRYAYCIESLTGNGYRRNDIHPIVKDDLSILVFTETKFIHLVCRTEHGIKIVKEKERPAALAARLASVQSISVVMEYQELTKLRKKL